MVTSSRRPRALATAFVAACGVVALQQAAFVAGGLSSRAPSRTQGSKVPCKAEYVELSEAVNAGLAGYQGNQWSLWVSFAVFATSFPGIYSTVTRTGQAKYVEKSYVMPGTASGGLEARSIAGGVVAYFKSQNYAMEDSPQKGKIRFVGNMQGSLSQALYLVGCTAGAFMALGFVLQVFYPAGPFGIGTDWWFLPVAGSPWAGFYYWGRAFRKDVVELQLETADDNNSMTLSALGDKETVENMQRGVRFQSAEGRLFQLMERGMEYVPGIWEEKPQVIYKESQPQQA